MINFYFILTTTSFYVIINLTINYGRKIMKQPTIEEHLNETMQPWIEYLIENYNNPQKVNSCLDVASDNIRTLESLIHNAQVYLRDFKTFKQIIISKDNKRKEPQIDSLNNQENENPEM